MKKVMFVMAVAGMFAFAACNNNTDATVNNDSMEAVEAPAVEEEATAEEATVEGEATEAPAEGEVNAQ